MPVLRDPSTVLEQQVPMYHLDKDNRYLMVMGVGPEQGDGALLSCEVGLSNLKAKRRPLVNFELFTPFQIPIEYDYDIMDIKHIIQAHLGYDPEDINIRAAGDFRPDESKMGPIFGKYFKEGWHMQASVYPKGWKSALEKWQEEQGN